MSEIGDHPSVCGHVGGCCAVLVLWVRWQGACLGVRLHIPKVIHTSLIITVLCGLGENLEVVCEVRLEI